MKNITLFLLLSLFCWLIISIPAAAQNEQKSEVHSKPVAFGPIDTSKGAAIAQATAEYFSATDAASEYRIDLNWEVIQGCFWGGEMSVSIYTGTMH